MCTLLFRYRPGDPYPLVILSNRDEQYDRATSGWSWHDGNPRFFAPRDEVAGGTWIGLSETGVVAALTNVFPPLKGDGYRSRGMLVKEMFALKSASKARRRVRSLLAEHETNKFNLLVADGTSAFMFSYDGLGLWEGRLEPGVYQVDNESWSGEKLNTGEGTNVQWMADNKNVLKEHPAICKHEENYGTRSSSILLLNGLDPANSTLWHADGNPCQSQYERIWGPEPA